MKKFGFALLVLMLGMGMLAGSAFATSYDPTGLPGQVPNPPVSPIIWNQGQAGDALYGDIYRSVADNTSFVTFFEIVNTSNNWTAIHVRLRAGRYSIEMIDFPVLLSPKDVFWFQMDVTSDGQGNIDCVQVYSADNTLQWNTHLVAPQGTWLEDFCVGDTSNIKLLEFGNWAHEAQTGASAATIEELSQGHIEVFGLWSFNYPRNASFLPDFWPLMLQFYNFGNFDPGIGDLIYPADVGKDLFGNVFLGDFTSGHYMGYPFRAIKDFRATNTDTYHRDFWLWNGPPGNVALSGAGAAVPNGVIVFTVPGFGNPYSDPDPFTNFGPTWNDGDDWIQAAAPHPAPGNPPTPGVLGPMASFSLDEVDDAFAKELLQSTYFNGGYAETYTLMAVSFPTKYLHDPTTLAWTTVGNPSGSLVARNGIFLGPRPILIEGCIWNLDEQGFVDFISPQDATQFPYEVNMVPIGAESQSWLADFCFLIWAPQQGFLNVPKVGAPGFPSFPAGWVKFSGFTWPGVLPRLAGWPNGLPNWGDQEYAPLKLDIDSLLNHLPPFIIPVSALTLDWENTNFSHSRMFDPSWDNPQWGIE